MQIGYYVKTCPLTNLSFLHLDMIYIKMNGIEQIEMYTCVLWNAA